MNLIGLVVVRNAITFDYIPKISANSLIPHCNEVIVADFGSHDGTYEDLVEYGKTDSRLRIISQPFEKPHNRPTWWVETVNYARENYINPNDWLIHLDADEVLTDHVGKAIKLAMENGTPGLFKRYNFWRDTKHLVPENRCCGDTVARLGPASMWLPSDEPHPLKEPNLRQTAVHYGGLEIYHFGFIRDKKKFVLKSEEVQNMFIGSCDDRLLQFKGKDIPWDSIDYFDNLPLKDFTGHPMPRPAREWLRSNGHEA